MLEFMTERIHTARKYYFCFLCGKRIVPGEKYVRSSGKYDGEMFDDKLHPLCKDTIRKYCFDMDKHEYTPDSVMEWLQESVCFDCGKSDGCEINTMSCQHIKDFITGGRKDNG
jgi:hypothetical protein